MYSESPTIDPIFASNESAVELCENIPVASFQRVLPSSPSRLTLQQPYCDRNTSVTPADFFWKPLKENALH
jgi:hypothetical protein